MNKYRDYIDNIANLNKRELSELISSFSYEDFKYACEKARKLTEEIFHKKIYIRGLIEFSNICKNNCYYCGIRCANNNIERYRLTKEEILDCCKNGYELGFRTFVLQAGEDLYFDDDKLCDIVNTIRKHYKDCAITLSIGERSFESYQRLYDAGANRYLLRHEAYDKDLYQKLHPEEMSYENRIRCLYDLRKIGYQVGCGMMIGAPYQTSDDLASDLLFMKDFKPEMVGIGPFLPSSSTPFKNEKAGSVELTLFMLSLIRLLLPRVLLPSTTALGSVSKDGRIRGIFAGANVYMPNLSPSINRNRYLLYDNKDSLNDDAKYVLEKLQNVLKEYDYKIEITRGDYEEE